MKVFKTNRDCFDNYKEIDTAIKQANLSIDEFRAMAIDDGWDEEVEQVSVYLKTHRAAMINEQPNGNCDYELQPTAEWQRIQEQLTELAKYKRCAVVGGDGEPIGINKSVFVRYDDEIIEGVVTRIQCVTNDDCIQVRIKSNIGPRLVDPSNCYSTESAVPED